VSDWLRIVHWFTLSVLAEPVTWIGVSLRASDS
jgi:hypothetical protein